MLWIMSLSFYILEHTNVGHVGITYLKIVNALLK